MKNENHQFGLNRRTQTAQSQACHRALRSLRTPVRIFLLLWIASAAETGGAQCYVDPITGLRTCPSRNSEWQPISGSKTTQLADATAPTSASGHCRIFVGNGNTGSGTLVERTKTTGLVLTCSHLFDQGSSRIVVAFPGGRQYGARLVERDWAHDLAALLICRPDVQPLAVGNEEPAGVLSTCGFGQAGQFRQVNGNVVGQATAAGATYPSVMIGGAVRPGDSGGGVLNAAGKLVGVVWGQRDGVSYATCGRPVREFLARVLGKERGASNEEREGSSRSSPLAPHSSPSPEIDWQAWSNEMEARIETLDAKKQDKGDYLQPGDLNGYLRHSDVPTLDVLATKDEVASLARESQRSVERVTSESTSRVEMLRKHLQARIEERFGASRPGLFAGLSLGKLIAGALGLSGPLTAAVIVAGGLAGRRVKKLGARRIEHGVGKSVDSPCSTCPAPSPIAVDSPPLPQRSVPETHYVPYEKDSFAKAHQWASEQVARKYPGATEVLQAQESLIKQHLAAN